MPMQSALAALDMLPEPVLVIGPDGKLVYANDLARNLLGDEPSLVGRGLRDLEPSTLAGEPVDRAWLEERIAADESPTLTVRGREGVRVARTFRGALSLVDGAASLVAMLDAPPAAADEGRAREEYRMVFDAVPVGILHFDAEGRVTRCNDVFVRQMGSTRAVITGVSMATLPNPGIREAVDEALAGRVGRFEGPYTSVTGGRSALFRATFSPILEDGAVRGGVGIIEDITERTEIEKRLAQGERMASLGRLAAGVAHEINNPLAYVRTSLDIARREIVRMNTDLQEPRAKRLIESIDRAEDGVERVRVIAGDLKTFSRGDESSWVPVRLERVADAAINLANNELRHRAELVREIAEVPPVMGSETRFVQVLVNLLVNAAQAFEDRDTFADRTERRPRVILRMGVMAAQPAAPEGERVFIEVEDNGAGIDPAIIPHVFEPFWTSKPAGVGTGLGLSICHGIVASAGGEIRVERSERGVGTTFRIELPATDPAEWKKRRASAQRPPRPTPTRRHRVMVVDDEPQLGIALRVALSERYDVTVSGSGQDALRRLGRGQRFDLVLCDLMMPEMTGMELYDAALEQVPDQVSRFVFMTGGAFTERAKTFLAEHAVPLLQKPFGLEEVHALLVRRSMA
ncbi:MAG: ATP-binding protein [Sandaracinaceae bacterium]